MCGMMGSSLSFSETVVIERVSLIGRRLQYPTQRFIVDSCAERFCRVMIGNSQSGALHGPTNSVLFCHLSLHYYMVRLWCTSSALPIDYLRINSMALICII